MKKFLLILPGLFIMGSTGAQVIFSENFTNVPVGHNPVGWVVSANTDVSNYERAYTCTTDKGLETPAVGKNVPARLILPSLNYNSDSNIILIRFKVFVYDANLDCATAKEFPCPTYVRVMLVNNSYTGGINELPDTGLIYSEQTYLISKANGDNTIIFNNPPVADETPFKIYLDFKTAMNTNCVSSGSKFVFDEFVVSKSVCAGDCAPVANDDYFNGTNQNFMHNIQANVYGGFALWASEVRSGYERKSLSAYPAVNDGVDYDVNNHPLSQMNFQLISQPEVIDVYCNSTLPAGTFNWFNDGSFNFTRTNSCVKTISFTYKVADPGGLYSDTATVTITFPPSNTLDVKMNTFLAERRYKEVELKWETITEKNNLGFYIQRNTGSGWEDRALVLSAGEDGNSNINNWYSFMDPNDFKGVSQYRLKQADQDGKISYSAIRLIPGLTAESGSRMILFPNPSRGQVTLLFENTGKQIELQVFDNLGRKIRQWTNLDASSPLIIKDLNPGSYILKAIDRLNGKMVTEKMLILEGY